MKFFLFLFFKQNYLLNKYNCSYTREIQFPRVSAKIVQFLG